MPTVQTLCDRRCHNLLYICGLCALVGELGVRSYAPDRRATYYFCRELVEKRVDAFINDMIKAVPTIEEVKESTTTLTSVFLISFLVVV